MTGRWTAGVHREVLANGLTLLVQHVDAPAVAVVTHVRAGFFDEPDHWVGISHVLEHMYFKGTPTRGPGEIARETKAAGGYLNAGTGYDHTSYYTVLPVDGLARAVDIQSDALRHASIDADELARELQVIIQEAKRKYDTPGALAWETLHEIMFDRHRIRRWRIGTEEMLAGFRREDVAGYYASRYVPERTVVAITGGMAVAEAVALGRRAWGEWPARPAAVDPEVPEPDQRVRRARTLRGDVIQSELVLGWRSRPPLDPVHTPMDLAAAVLSAGRASRLQRAVRETGLAGSIGAHHYAPTEVGVFAISATLEPDRQEAVLRAVAAEVRDLATAGPSVEELERARTLVLARWAKRMESVEGRASALASAEALDGIDWLDREYERVAAVTPDAVREAAGTLLRSDGVSGVVYHPHGRGEDLTVPALVDAFEREGLARPAPVGGRSSPGPRPPAARPAGRVTAGVLHVALAGTDLLVQRKTGVPLVTLGVYRRRRQAEDAALAGLGALAIRSAIRGAGDLDAATLADRFERLGGSVSPSVSHDTFGFSATVLAEHAGTAADLLRLVLREPQFEDETLAVERTLLAEDARRAADDMLRYPVQLALAARFADAGYGIPMVGLPGTVPELTAAMVRAWHGGELAGGRTAVVAAGDLEPERMADLLAGVFGADPASAAEGALDTPAGVDAGAHTRAVERERAQSALAMLFPGPSRRDPERHAAEVWAAVAGGLGGRLFESLRSRRSLAYTVVASSWQRARAGGLFTYIATSPEREDEARAAMLEELEAFTRAPVTSDELTGAIAYLAGQAAVSRQAVASVAGETLDAWLLGEGLEELGDPGAPYRAVTAEAVLEVARASLLPESRVEGVVRGTGGGR